MRRYAILTFVVVLTLTGVLVGSRTQVGGQEATPEPTVTGDISVELTDLGIVDALPPAPASIVYYRLSFPTGATLSFPPGDPGLGLWVIESGTLTLRTFSGDISVTRAAGQATSGTQSREVLPAGAETELGPGDGFLWMPLLGGEVRNDGTEPVVLVTVDIRTQAEGTPSA